MDRREEAATTIERALAIAGRIEHPPVIWRALALSAEWARREGDDGLARERLERAARLVEEKAVDLPEPDLRAELRALGQRLTADAVNAHR
jgi:hypothetical protein